MRFIRLCRLPWVLGFSVLLLLSGCGRQFGIHRGLAQGKQYFDAGEFEKAKITYLGVLRSEPLNATAIKQIGLIWFEQGVPLETVRFLRKAHDLDPKDPTVTLKLAHAFFDLREFDEARKDAEAVLQADPEQPEALFLLAQMVRSDDDVNQLAARLQNLTPTKPGVLLAQATIALHRHDLPAAETATQRAIAADPKFSSAYLEKAVVAILNKDIPGATEAFQQASALAPRSAASLAYASFLQQQGNTKGATDYLPTLAEKLGDYVPLWILQARTELNDKKPDAASASVARALQIDPGNLEGLLLKSQIFLSKGDTDQAIGLLKEINAQPVYAGIPVTRFELGRAYLLKSNPSQAIAALNEALKIKPDYQEALLLLAQLKLQQGDPQGVVDSMQTILHKTPNLLPAQLLLAQAYRSQGNFADASRVLQAQLQVTPNEVEPHLLLGLIMLQEGKNADARAAFEAVDQLAPGNLFANYYLVELDLAEKKPDQALQRAQGLVQKLPDTPGPLYVLARVQIAQEHWDAAEDELRKSIQLDPNFTSAYDLLVSIYKQTNKLDLAAAETQAFLTRNPENTAALLTLAVIQEQLQDFDKARDTYQRVIQANPNSATALNNLAGILADHFKQLDKAYEMASRARTLQPDEGLIADTLGWIDYLRQDYQQAISLLRESVGKDPDNSVVQYHFGMASYMTGQTDAARAALTKAAAAPGDFAGKDEIPGALAMLGGGSQPGKAMSNEQLEGALQQHPDNLVVRQTLAGRYEKTGDYAKAAALWEAAVRANPRLLSAILNLAKLYAGPLHDPGKAFDYAKQARALAPGDPDVAKIAGQAAYRSGNFEWAYSLLQEAAQQPGAGADLLSDYAEAAYDLGRVEEAQRTLRSALKIAPAGPLAEEAKQFLALTALEGKPQNLTAKQADINAALERDPANVPALMLRAEWQAQQGQTDQAAAIYTGILSRLPEFGPALKRLAAIDLAQPGRLNDAFELAAKARQNLPDDPEVAQILAAARFQRKEYPSVVELLEESAARRPLTAPLLFDLGMARLQLKQKTAGFQALNQAIAAGLDGPEAAEAKRTLAAQ